MDASHRPHRTTNSCRVQLTSSRGYPAHVQRPDSQPPHDRTNTGRPLSRFRRPPKDLHFRAPKAQTAISFFFSLPGAIALPAVMTTGPVTGTPAFLVRINEARLTQYSFVDGDEAERTWHEIIPANTPGGPTLRTDNNELVFFALRRFRRLRRCRHRLHVQPNHRSGLHRRHHPTIALALLLRRRRRCYAAEASRKLEATFHWCKAE